MTFDSTTIHLVESWSREAREEKFRRWLVVEATLGFLPAFVWGHVDSACCHYLCQTKLGTKESYDASSSSHIFHHIYLYG